MYTRTSFKDRRLALAGFGAEGQSAADFLLRMGARLEISDSKPESEFPTEVVARIRELGAVFHFGQLGPFTGFDGIIRSPGISPHVPELVTAAKKGIPFTSATKIFFDLCPAPIVGVTGTKGKGTTASLIYQMLKGAGRDAYLCGNIGTPALDFLDRLNEGSIVVYELSSFHLLEMERSPHIAVVLMVTSEHLDFHKTAEEYVGAKANLVRFQGPGDYAIVNMDYPASRAMAAMTKAEVFAVSRKKRPANGTYVENGFVTLIQKGQSRQILPIDAVPLAGAHNLENVCAAAITAALFGVPSAITAAAIQYFKALPHRLEFIRETAGVKYYDDSISTTPESAIAALRSFGVPKILILGGSSKGADWREFAAELTADHSLKAIIGIGKEWPKIKAALAATGREVQAIEGLQNMSAVVAAAAELAAPGNIVILSPACASFGMFRNYQDRGEQFSAAVRAL